jgi:hypothetical protein
VNVLGCLEEVLLLYKELLCNSSLLSILEFFSMLTFSIHGVYLGLLCYLKYLVFNLLYIKVSLQSIKTFIDGLSIDFPFK